MRIVFVAWNANNHTRRWARFFAERGHEVHVVTCGDAAPGASASYDVHDLGPPRFGKLGYILKIPRARRLIRSLQPDVVHAHHATSYGMLGFSAGVHPFVVTCHGSDVLRSPANQAMRLVVSRVLRAADLITVPASHVRRAAERLGALPARIAVFQYGVELARLEEVRAAAAPRPAGDRARIVTARPLTPLYHTDVVVQAVALLDERGAADLVYDVAGAGSERPALERLAASLGVADRVVFHGQLAENDAERLLASGDVYVSVAESDGVSIALLEAMALGLVPVVSDIEANREWITSGENGVLVSISSDSVADGIAQALALDRGEVGRRNAKIVRARADRTANLAQCERLLAELVSPGGG